VGWWCEVVVVGVGYGYGRWRADGARRSLSVAPPLRPSQLRLLDSWRSAARPSQRHSQLLCACHRSPHRHARRRPAACRVSVRAGPRWWRQHAGDARGAAASPSLRQGCRRLRLRRRASIASLGEQRSRLQLHMIAREETSLGVEGSRASGAQCVRHSYEVRSTSGDVDRIRTKQKKRAAHKRRASSRLCGTAAAGAAGAAGAATGGAEGRGASEGGVLVCLVAVAAAAASSKKGAGAAVAVGAAVTAEALVAAAEAVRVSAERVSMAVVLRAVTCRKLARATRVVAMARCAQQSSQRAKPTPAAAASVVAVSAAGKEAALRMRAGCSSSQ
jgi:hypothetical protein